MRVFLCMAILAILGSLEISAILEIGWPFKLVMAFFIFVALIQDLAELGRK